MAGDHSPPPERNPFFTGLLVSIGVMLFLLALAGLVLLFISEVS